MWRKWWASWVWFTNPRYLSCFPILLKNTCTRTLRSTSDYSAVIWTFVPLYLWETSTRWEERKGKKRKRRRRGTKYKACIPAVQGQHETRSPGNLAHSNQMCLLHLTNQTKTADNATRHLRWLRSLILCSLSQVCKWINILGLYHKANNSICGTQRHARRLSLKMLNRCVIK